MKSKNLETSLDIDEFIKFYQNHNIRDTAKYFNISINRITQICKQISFKKDKQTIANQIKVTKLSKYDSVEALNKANREKQSNTLIRKYGSIEAANRVRVDKIKATKANNKDSFDYKIKHINKDEFIDLYISQNKPRIYMMDRYDLTSYMLDRIIAYFDCNKSHKQSSELALDSKYAKFGGKTQYFDILVSKIKSSKVVHYGSWAEAKKATANSCRNTWMLKTHEDKQEILARTKQTNLNKYGVECCYQLPNCRLKGNNSKPNIEFGKLLDSANISYTREFALANRSYDFKVNDTLIEINPSATHNSTYGIYDNKPLSSNYHKQKSELADMNNYRCIHIWDWDDKEKIINNLKSRESIYARKCDLREISKYQLDDFLNNYHFQNTCKNQSIRLGLFYKNELIQVMSFGKPRYNKNYQYELLRLCTRSEYKVIGGSEKLFKYFLNNYKPQSIISYCDKSKFNGRIYEKLGFSLISNGVPTKHWFNLKTKKHILDSSLRMRGFDILLGNEYGCFGKGTSNEQLMLDHGFIEIFDSGQASYKYIAGERDGTNN